MIVGSNERKFAWMDEGFNTFINTSEFSFVAPDYHRKPIVSKFMARHAPKPRRFRQIMTENNARFKVMADLKIGKTKFYDAINFCKQLKIN